MYVGARTRLQAPGSGLLIASSTSQEENISQVTEGLRFGLRFSEKKSFPVYSSLRFSSETDLLDQ